MKLTARHESAWRRLVCVCVGLTILSPGCVTRVPLIKGRVDLTGPDYTTSNTLAPRIKPMFAPDGVRDIFSAWRGRVDSLHKNVTVLYFRPRTAPITNASLTAQVRDIWNHYKNELPTGDLDIFILRGVPPPPSWQMYSYVFMKDDQGRWARVQDADHVDSIIRAEYPIMWATLE